MNLLSRLFERHTPELVKRKVLDELVTATADAFDEPAPAIGGRRFDERLTRYAIYTRDAVTRAQSDGRDLSAIEQRLFTNALALGRRLRDLLGVDPADTTEVMRAGRALYQAIGIDLRGTSDGEVTIDECLFSRYYTPEICRVISSLDAGLFAGLSGGDRLVFVQRITEGAPCCRARLTAGEGSP